MTEQNNIYVMPGAHAPVSTEPDERLVAQLRDMLAMAESGQLRSLVATGFLANGDRLTAWATTHENVAEMMGALTLLPIGYAIRTGIAAG